MKRLRIGVDARPLTRAMDGICRYTHELLRRLVQTEHEWFIYADKPLVHGFPEASNIHVRVDAGKAWLNSSLWIQLFLPKLLMRDHIEVFWSPRHHLPLKLPAGIRTVVSIHDLVWQRCPETMPYHRRALESFLMPRTVAQADAVLAISEASKSDLLEFFGAPAKSKLHLVYPGGGESFGQSSLPSSPPCFLFVGTLEPRKNLLRVLKAFSHLLQSYADCRLLIVGAGGWGGLKLDEEIRKLELSSRVTLIGHATEQELREYYRAAYALVMPSLYEGFGLPLVEAMSHGLPLVVSGFGAQEEVAADAGVAVDPLSVESIASGMARVLDADVRAELSIRSRKRALDFTWERSAGALLQVLEAGSS